MAGREASSSTQCVKYTTMTTQEDLQFHNEDVPLVEDTCNHSKKSLTPTESESQNDADRTSVKPDNNVVENGHIPSTILQSSTSIGNSKSGVGSPEKLPKPDMRAGGDNVKSDDFTIIPNSETTDTFLEDNEVSQSEYEVTVNQADVPATLSDVPVLDKETEQSENFANNDGTVPLLTSREMTEKTAPPENIANDKVEMDKVFANGNGTNGTIPLVKTQGSIKNVDDVLSQLKFGWFQVKMLMLTGGAYFAMCAQIMCVVFLSTPIKTEWSLSKYSFSWLPFSTGVTSIIGGFIVGTLSDRFGRQRPFLACMVLFMISGIVSPFANSFGLLIALRGFVALAIGGLSAVNFVLLIEVLPRERRGCHMVIITLCGAMGAVLAGGLAWLLLEKFGWRVFLGACAAPSVVVVILRLFVSFESPRYLLASNQPEKALEVLKTIAKNNKTTLPDVEISCPPSESRGRMQDLFTPKLRRRTVFVSLIWVLQSMGFWGVSMYMPEYMTKLGVNPYFSMFTIFIGEIPGLLFAMILIERHMFGRLHCLRFFSLCTMICLIVFAVVNLDFLRAVFIVVCYFFMVPVYSILNTLTPEIYPTSLRSTAMAWMNIIIEVPSLVTPFVGEVLLSSRIPWLYPIVWAICFMLQFIFTFGLRTETAGCNLDENINDQNSDSSQSRDSGHDMTEIRLRVGESAPSDNDSDSIGCEIF